MFLISFSVTIPSSSNGLNCALVKAIILPLYKSTLSTEVSNKLLIIATPFAGFVSMTFCNDLPFENMYLDLPSPNLTIKSAG